jgi:murein DD-endopeptidase MepM/ murein hydrolase activator NlpD
VIKVKGGCVHDYGVACSCNGGYGNYVQIDHGNGLCTLYAHLASISVSSGQKVSAGTVVGKIGATGNVVSSGGGGYHLHFSVIVNGTFVDPMPYLN